MATQTLDHNPVGFQFGIHGRDRAYVDAAQSPAAGAQGLAARGFLALPDADFVLVCLAGELWLTRDGDFEDYLLGPGQRVFVGRGDKAAVQALKPSRVRLLVA